MSNSRRVVFSGILAVIQSARQIPCRQQIRHQTRFADQGIVIQLPGETADRDTFHGADLKILQTGDRFHGQQIVLLVGAVGDLKREHLAAQHRDRFKRRTGRRRRPLKNLDQ